MAATDPPGSRYLGREVWELLVFAPGSTPDKYWPRVTRADNAYGDRNLVFHCPPLEAFAE